ncbi:hypothetical protein SAMD00019534_048730 [Acytostelium subglobosum LB1]|uniref:hypothetical protein n=1 Tax=Acytostelium subglobosum LB1 TaxID=1410327 RepID=UPI000644D28E|nr:hypothetical protein SAMD00019534_048730 [Acytostelium subglobosum LB1]GAM21698.1 hypothetical protein SAMD00019534_048730 [Acytostelium subglobosum LB1]|eukprot:XP_012755817.1 hypothetical protein SAMD00019534_048730 [Acytostelium subglobosum LB1]
MPSVLTSTTWNSSGWFTKRSYSNESTTQPDTVESATPQPSASSGVSNTVFQRAKVKGTEGKPLIAIVGKPNVGKSTLFNRLVQGSRQALVEDIPGTTRDRFYGEALLYGHQFQLVDTGGLVGEAAAHTDHFAEAIKTQATIAMDEADSIIFLLDAKTGITGVDREIARMLRTKFNTQGKKVFLGINKADNDDSVDRLPMDELRRLGLGDPYPFSAIHGAGVLTLLDKVLKSLPDSKLALGDPSEQTSIKISIVGQPNAGKSSLLNQIIGEERSIVSDISGTTHDPVDCNFIWRDIHDLTLIDTAGIRRRSTHKIGLEKSSVLWAMKAIERSHVVLMMIDSTVGLTDQDLKIADFITQNNKSVVLIINKWDLYAQNKKKAAKLIEKKQFHDLQERYRPNLSLLDEILDDNNIIGGGKKNKRAVQLGNVKNNEEMDEDDNDEDDQEEDEEEDEDNDEEEELEKKQIMKKNGLSKKEFLIQTSSSKLSYDSDFWPSKEASDRRTKEQDLLEEIEQELDNIKEDEVDGDVEGDNDAVDYLKEEDNNEEDQEEKDEEEREYNFIKAYWKYMKKLEIAEAEGKKQRPPPPEVKMPVLSKEQKEYERTLREKLTFLDYAPAIFTSAKTGFCVPTAMDLAIKIFFEREKRLRVKELMAIIKQATFKHKMPKKGKRNLRIKFAIQSKGYPPSFVFFVNDPDKVQPSINRYLLNSIRETYPFVGTPISIFFRRNKRRPTYKRKQTNY